MEIKKVLNQIVKRLKLANPYKIVLFGSHAKGIATPESDIDLMVILDNHHLPKNYAEQLKMRRDIKKMTLDINFQYPMDLKIYTHAEFKELKKRGSFFIGEIEKTGVTIYEKSY